MTLTRLIAAALLLLLAALGWRYRDAEAVRQFLSPPASAKPAPIQFDNGTVRDYAPAASATAATPPRPPGGVRKCRKAGGELVYTDGTCPPGSREQALAGGSVNVLPAADAGQAPVKTAPGQPGATDQTLGPQLREKMVERAVHGTP